mmetsp:Transcript_42235/g.83162  ORF Transcript_42235/g.83162 Transcript_42235/m.83162 type:complete len:255 (+) Transcript_42235:672-1436(+)
MAFAPARSACSPASSRVSFSRPFPLSLSWVSKCFTWVPYTFLSARKSTTSFLRASTECVVLDCCMDKALIWPRISASSLSTLAFIFVSRRSISALSSRWNESCLLMALSSSLLNCALKRDSCSDSLAAASSSKALISSASLAWSFFMTRSCSERSCCTCPTSAFTSASFLRFGRLDGRFSNALECKPSCSARCFEVDWALAVAAFSFCLRVSSLESMTSCCCANVSSRTFACCTCCWSITPSTSARLRRAATSS